MENIMRLARVKQPILDTLTCVETYEENVPTELKKIDQSDDYWEVNAAFCMMNAAMARILWLADRRVVGMDKLCYFVDKCEETMIKKAKHVNCLFPLPNDPSFKDSIWQKCLDYLGSSAATLKNADKEMTAFNTDLNI
jgi:hypothetical protein